MPHATPLYHSFLVRFWFEPIDGRWYGELEDVQRDQRAAITSFNEVLPLLMLWSDPVAALLHDQQTSATSACFDYPPIEARREAHEPQ